MSYSLWGRKESDMNERRMTSCLDYGNGLLTGLPAPALTLLYPVIILQPKSFMLKLSHAISLLNPLQ